MGDALHIPAQLNVADHFLDRHLREGRGDRTAIAGVGPPVTYAELAERTRRFAALLAELGVGAGDRVLLVLPDSPEFVACFFGAVRAGAVAVPVNPFTRKGDYVHYATDSGASLAVVHQMSFAQALPALTELLPQPRVLTAGGRAMGCDSLEEGLARSTAKVETHATTAEDTAFFLYTSGSGGQPKGAVHRHSHMLITAQRFADQVLGIRTDDSAFSVSKLFFAYGLGNGMYFPFSVGATSILLPDRPTPEKIIAVMREYRPSLFFSVPTIYGALLREPQEGWMDSVRVAVSAGEALPVEIFEGYRRQFRQEVIDGIGTTEMLHMFISNRPGEVRPGSCGREVPGYEARIVTDDGEEAPPDEIGSLWVRGASAFAGYWQKPELTARTKTGDWVITGDKFFRDSDGFYHYCGRTDDMLKVSGMWVSPTEVENTLLGHEAVAEAAVVGRCAEDGLLQVVAFVVGRDSQPSRSLTEELRVLVRKKLPGYKCPQAFRFVSELPKTATGKIQRYKLRS